MTRHRMPSRPVADLVRATSLVALVALTTPALHAQEPQGAAADPKPYIPVPLFQDSTALEITLHAPFRRLGRDRQEDTDWRYAQVEYSDNGVARRVGLRVRTRGVWRKANCEIPPLLFNFAKDSVRGTLFDHIDRLRLSMHCRNRDDYEQYVLQEFNLYRVQRLLTKYSFDVRLARVRYVDPERGDTVATRWAFFQEQDEPFADRVGVMLVEQKGAGPSDLDPYESAFFGVWQYFVANSDFSISGLHNVVLTYLEPKHIPVARDFDWSGAVNARYARPNPVLKIPNVRYRIMRGYCAPPLEYLKVFDLFREKKAAIYALYSATDPVGRHMTEEVRRWTLEYFDEFYKVIDDPDEASKEIIDRCLGGPA